MRLMKTGPSWKKIDGSCWIGGRQAWAGHCQASGPLALSGHWAQQSSLLVGAVQQQR
jgi:hypothetical protein